MIDTTNVPESAKLFQNQNIIDFIEYAAKETGRTELSEQASRVIGERDQLRLLAKEPPGAERVIEQLGAQEQELQGDAKRNRDAQVHLYDQIGRGNIALETAEMEDRRRKLKEGSILRKTLEQTDPLMTVLSWKAHRSRLSGLRALVREMKAPLREYKRARLLGRVMPRVGYLVLAIAIFVLGANAVDENFHQRAIKIAIAFALWAFEEFVFTPFVQSRLARNEKVQLEKAIKHLAFIRCWNIAATALVEQDLARAEAAAKAARNSMESRNGTGAPDQPSTTL